MIIRDRCHLPVQAPGLGVRSVNRMGHRSLNKKMEAARGLTTGILLRLAFQGPPDCCQEVFFMSASRFSVRRLTLAAVIAAAYAGLTLLLPIPQYGPVQLRVAEAMTLLPFLFPEAIPGLAVGCFLANLLGSPYVLDWVFGTFATLLGACLTAKMPNRYLAALPPVICNAVIVGAEIAYFSTLDGVAFLPAFAMNAATVGAGEALVCFVLGPLLLRALGQVPALRGRG